LWTFYITSVKVFYLNYSGDRGPHVGQPWSRPPKSWGSC